LAAISGLVSFLIFFLLWGLRARNARNVDELVGLASLSPSARKHPLLVLRAVDDEASLVLAAAADANTSTLSPTERIRLLMAARTDASSSMTKTTGGTFAAVVLVVNSRISLGKASPRSAARMRSAGLAEERNESSFLGLPDTLFPRVKFERPIGAPQGLGLGNAGRKLARSVTSHRARNAIGPGAIC
jgi:hypothetical protein